MNKKIKLFLICVAIPLIVGLISGFISRNAMSSFGELIKPPLSPPAILFPIVWTILYILMGIASYLILTSNATPEEKENALSVYGLQLFVNFFWSIFFFNLEWYLFSFLWLLLLWILIFNCITLFYHINKTAAYLMIPYLIWVTFAGYFNLSIYLLN